MLWPITYERKVRYGDIDSQGIVFNGNYLTYYDDAITDLFIAAELTPDVTHAAGYDVVTAHATVDFRATAGLFETLEVDVRVARIGNTSVTFSLQSRVGDRITTEATIIYVTVDAETLKPVPVPETFAAAMQAVHDEQIVR
ncbi:MAG: acyl-CoA thioesterase [bacterium]|nr:acyl-CoA thioesterase [bacterium]